MHSIAAAELEPRNCISHVTAARVLAMAALAFLIWILSLGLCESMSVVEGQWQSRNLLLQNPGAAISYFYYIVRKSVFLCRRMCRHTILLNHGKVAPVKAEMPHNLIRSSCSRVFANFQFAVGHLCTILLS